MATTMHWLPTLPAASATSCGLVDRGGVHADLVGPGVEQAPHVVDAAHATTDGERDEDLLGHLLDHVQDDVAVVGAGGDVEEGDLVGALLVVAAGNLDRITGIPQFDEIDAFDDPAGGDVEAGNDALGEHELRRPR
jgi:hypothetical protein